MHAGGKRVLIVEDERDIADLIALHLRDIFDDVAICDSGTDGLARASGENWDLIILDLRLPGIDGLEICRSLRRNSRYAPILMLTAKSAELDRVLGLESGADDYLTKPFSVLELVARARAILRRAGQIRPAEDSGAAQEISHGALKINRACREVIVDGRPVELTAREFDLLIHFASQPGRVFRRAELLDSVWGYGHEGYEHTVNSHINRLRAKIERDPARPQQIVTVWGVGYKFSAGATQGA
jgi:DNA-binding response OmpR family regulator